MFNYSVPIFKISSAMIWSILLVSLPLTAKVVWLQATYVLEWVMLPLVAPIHMTLVVDPIGVMFASVVLLISANVLMFSSIYMEEEKFKSRFTILVLLFILSMNLLIFIPHFMILLLGWDGLGIVSFVLVIYYQNPKSLAAGMITALTNRVGDVLLLVSIAWTLNQGHWNILNMWSTSMSIFQISCITLAAMTKSAQMPFSSWLPAAMAAPTPVSALVHSSTLVTAGVFLLIRFYPFLHSWKFFNTFILLVAVCTMFMAGISAITECDAKKIIALSTLSQLGMMMTSLGFNLPHLAFFHMLTHALFKALLFVCAGSFIHYHLHTQDLRWMGNLSTQMPVATSCINLANLALAGFPFMAGFYSKDMIIEAAMSTPNNIWMLAMVLLSLGFTSFYSMRFSVETMFGPTLVAPWTKLSEEKNIIVPMLVLSSMSIIAGSTMVWLYPLSSSVYFVPLYIKFMPLTLVTIGALTSYLLITTNKKSECALEANPMNHTASCLMWFLVPLSSQFMLGGPLKSAHLMLKHIDHGWLEMSSGMKLNSTLFYMNTKMITNSPSLASSYLVTSIIGVTAILICSYL